MTCKTVSAPLFFHLSNLRNLYPVMFESKDNSRCPVIDMKLSQDRGDMILHRLVTNTQQFSNLFIAHTLATILQNIYSVLREWASFQRTRVIFHCRAQVTKRLQDTAGQGWLKKQRR